MSFFNDNARFINGPDGTRDSYSQPPLPAQQISSFQNQIQSQVQNVQSQQSLQFNQYLQQLLKQNSRDIRRNPRVGHKELDLYALYLAVQKRGGYKRITQWKYLAQDLDLPSSVTNSGYILRTKYESFIMPYEAQLLQQFPVEAADQTNPNNYSFAGNAALVPQFSQQNNYDFPQPLYQNSAPQQIRKLILMDIQFTDNMLRSQIQPNKLYEEIELSDLRNIKLIIPASQFPKTLRVLKLHGVPNALVPDMFMEYAQLNLVEMQIEAAGEGCGPVCGNQLELGDFGNSSNLEVPRGGPIVHDLD